jgi:hypothetical protein
LPRGDPDAPLFQTAAGKTGKALVVRALLLREQFDFEPLYSQAVHHILIVWTASVGSEPKEKARWVDLPVPLVAGPTVSKPETVSAAARVAADFSATRWSAELYLKRNRAETGRVAC